MFALDLFKKFLLSRKAGSIVRRIARLTIISMSVSITALLVVFSIMNALNKNIRDRTLSVEPHLYIEMLPGSPAALLEIHPAIAKLRQNPENIVHLSENQDLILRTADGKFRGAVARGLDSAGMKYVFTKMSQVRSQQLGRDHFDFDMSMDRGEVFIGRDLARMLGVIEGDQLTALPPEGLLLPVGESPRLDKVRIRRIIATDIADVDAQTIFFYRGSSLQNLKSQSSRKLAAEVWLKDPFDSTWQKKQLASFADIRVLTWQERNSAIFQSLRLEKMILLLFLSLASLIAALSVVSVMGLLVQQKKKEIALLQVLGLSAQKTQNLFLRLGFILSGLGLLIGVSLGLGISLYLQKYPLRILPDIYYDSAIPALVEPWFFMIVVVGGIFISWLSAYISVRPITSISAAIK